MISIKEAISRSGKIKNELAYRAARSERKTLKALCIRIMNAFGIAFKDSYTDAPVSMAMESFDAAFGEGITISPSYSIIYEMNSPFSRALESARSIDVMDDMMAIEGFIFKKKGKKDVKTLMPSRYDIDTILIEIDRIKNHQDRIYVLDLIYNKMEDLTVMKEAMEHDSNLQRKYGTDVQLMLDQLESMRNTVLKKNQLDKKYKLWVQVPAGYEG